MWLPGESGTQIAVLSEHIVRAGVKKKNEPEFPALRRSVKQTTAYKKMCR